MATYAELARSLYPNMPIEILNLFSTEWAKTGDPSVAIANVRQTDAYATAFPGNKRPDGTIKFGMCPCALVRSSPPACISSTSRYFCRGRDAGALTNALVNLIEP